MTLFGQSTLAGRRLLEAGATLVSVFWDEYGPANTAWDTHFNHYERLKDELLPGLDSALSALIADLEERGMFDDTLIMCLTEHGRTPKITLTRRGVGREHWSNVYCNLLAGGGISRGRVVGSSDRNGGFVKDDPVSPKDVLTTMYHLMGVDPHTTIRTPVGQPLPLVSGGNVLWQMLG
jgi:arylsulfatase A-like enzyme